MLSVFTTDNIILHYKQQYNIIIHCVQIMTWVNVINNPYFVSSSSSLDLLKLWWATEWKKEGESVCDRVSVGVVGGNPVSTVLQPYICHLGGLVVCWWVCWGGKGRYGWATPEGDARVKPSWKIVGAGADAARNKLDGELNLLCHLSLPFPSLPSRILPLSFVPFLPALALPCLAHRFPSLISVFLPLST